MIIDMWSIARKSFVVSQLLVVMDVQRIIHTCSAVPQAPATEAGR